MNTPDTQPTPAIDSDAPRVIAFARDKAGQAANEREKAVRLYYAVRDTIRYDPYNVDLSIPGLRASTTLQHGRGWCVPKAVLLAACCRALGIPARLGFADVRNHLSTARLRAYMKTDVFYWHGYTAIKLEDKWVKVTPAFNIELCQRFKLKTLDFDGRHDSLLQPFDLEGHQHMEYLRYHGEFQDLPLERIAATFRKEYAAVQELQGADWDRDVQRETDGSAKASR